MGRGLFDLSGKTAVVAGGTSGIGRTLALGLADAGADVVVVGRREGALRETASAIEARGRRTLRLTADVTDRASLERARDACLQTFGHVDILIAAAGISTRVSTLAMDDGDWRRIIDTNLTGTFNACQVFGAGMVERKSGRIITVASLSSQGSRAHLQSSGRRTA
jgi:NAD(P)-dependent dehydrogenase (short-subunit alcohol dehydrogenase family)